MAAIPRSVTLNGVAYMVDPTKFQRSAITPLREGVVTSNEPTDALFNAEAAWSRYRYSWHHGAGQAFDDLREDADPFRYLTSLGMDVWTEGELTLLHSTEAMLSGVSGTVRMVRHGAYVMFSRNSTTLSRYDGTTYTDLTAPGGNITDLASDGTNFYVATTTGLIPYTGSGSASAFAAPVAATYHSVAFVANRLLASTSNVLNEVATTGALTVIKTHFQAAFRWTAIFAVGSRIYAGGFAGTRSELYSFTTDSAGVLVQSAEALVLPLGELIYCAVAHAGVVLLGTNQGFRLAQIGTDGTLTYGPLVDEYGSVADIAVEGRFACLACSNGGLAKVALDTFTDTLKPAHASDVQPPSYTGSAVAVACLSGGVLFNSGSTICRTTTDYVEQGYVDSGRIYFGTVEPKVFAGFVARGLPLDDADDHEIAVSIIAEDESTKGSGSVQTLDETVLSVSASTITGTVTWYRVRVIINSNGDSTPTLHSWRLRAYPVPEAAQQWVVPLILRDAVDINGQDTSLDVRDAQNLIIALFDARVPVDFVIGGETHTVRVNAYRFDGENWSAAGDALQGTMTVQLVEL